MCIEIWIFQILEGNKVYVPYQTSNPRVLEKQPVWKPISILQWIWEYSH